MATRRVRRAALRSALVLAAGFGVFFAWSSYQVVRQASLDEAREADAIIVFGAAEYSGRPSPVLRARLEHAFALYQRKLAPVIITTGGAGWDPTYSEGGVGRDYLARKGIPDRHLIAETYSDNTSESAVRAANIMRTNGMKTCVAVSDPYHLFRVKAMMQANGIETYTSPRPQAEGSPDKKKLQSIAREALGYMAWRLHITKML